MRHPCHKLFTVNQMVMLPSDERKQIEQREEEQRSYDKGVKPAELPPAIGSKHKMWQAARQPLLYCWGAGLAASQARSCSMRCGSCT